MGRASKDQTLLSDCVADNADATVIDANVDAVLSVLRKKDKGDRMA